jgi:hypothetical protein
MAGHADSSGLHITSFSKPKLQIIHPYTDYCNHLFDLLWNAVRWVWRATSSRREQPHHAGSGNYVKFLGFSYINQSYNEAHGATTNRPTFHWNGRFNNKNFDFIRLPADSAISQNIYTMHDSMGARGSVVVKAVCYKQEGCGLETQWGGRISFFNLPNPSCSTRPWGSLIL